MQKRKWISVDGGTIELPYGENGLVIEVIQGRASMRAVNRIQTTRGTSNGKCRWESGDMMFTVQVQGTYVKGLAGGEAVYTNGTRTLTLAGAFKYMQAGNYIEITGGTDITAGYYEIEEVLSDDSVVLVDEPGTSSNSDTFMAGFSRLGHYTKGFASFQLGTGETWTGSVEVDEAGWTGSWSQDRAGAVLSIVFNDDIERV